MNTPNVRPVAPGQSLADKHPELLAEWDYEANDLNPTQVTPGSGRIAHWVCSECGHRWAAKVAHRTSGRGCMMCGHKKTAAARSTPEPGQSLANRHPQLAAEWHHELNERDPEDVTAGSNLRAHWQCRDCGHQWQAMIKSRAVGAGCPACATRVPKTASVCVRCPELTDEWDGDRNDRAPSAVRPGSDYRAYWVCRHCGHRWQSRVSNRTGGTGCPSCSKAAGLLGSEHPDLTNRLTDPDDANVRSRSSRMVQLWCDGTAQGQETHSRTEYLQAASSLVQGRNGCPVCGAHIRLSLSSETAPCEPSSPHRNDMTTSEKHVQTARNTDPTGEVND